jgi:ATP diphosphatase
VVDQSGIERLLEVMARLRDPQGGCPWDLEQDFASIAPYTIEEAYEVADAIERGDLDELEGELGDLLLQVVYHARMAEEAGRFDFEAVAHGIADKMIRRHPHVFGDDEARSAGAAKGFWEKIKAEEKQERARRRSPDDVRTEGLLDDVAAGHPALARAVKLQQKASTVGFDWNDARLVMEKVREETDEIAAELDRSPREPERLSDEIGDLLFAVANLARHVNVDPDQALRQANAKFVSRFGYVEAALAADGRTPGEASLDEMEQLWHRAKSRER